MELYWLDKNKKGRGLLPLLKKILLLKWDKKEIKFKIWSLLSLIINGQQSTNIEAQLNNILKTPLTEWDIVSLLTTLNINNNIANIDNIKIYTSFIDNTLIVTNFEQSSNNSNVDSKKEIELKMTDELDLSQLKNSTIKEINNDITNDWTKVRDMMDILRTWVLFCSDNSIWDIWIQEWKKIYFIKWEDVIYTEQYKKTIDEYQKQEFTKKDLKYFTRKMMELSAINSYWPVEKLTEKEKKDREEFLDELETKLRKIGYVDFAVKVEWRKLRVNISYSNWKKLTWIMRVIEGWTPPPMEKLGLIGWKNGTAYKDVLSAPFWLILICGPTGSWKSMSLTSMIWHINKTQRKHIITLEDPIEFEHEDINSVVEQKEVWVDIKSYADWLKAILRQKPQIAVLWEIRDWEVMEKGIELASTWHVVFATFHSNDVASTLTRILQFFPWKEKDKAQELSEFILWIFVQKLVSRKGGWKILIKEIMIKTEQLSRAIKEVQIWLLNKLIEAGWKYWMISNDQSIRRLYDEWLISAKTAVNFAKDKPFAKKLTNYDEYA